MARPTKPQSAERIEAELRTKLDQAETQVIAGRKSTPEATQDIKRRHAARLRELIDERGNPRQ